MMPRVQRGIRARRCPCAAALSGVVTDHAALAGLLTITMKIAPLPDVTVLNIP